MSRISAEQIINWTTPPDFQITPHCTSDAEYHELRGWVTAERQDWLLDISRRRLDQLTVFESQRGPRVRLEPRDPAPDDPDLFSNKGRPPLKDRSFRWPAHWDLPLDTEPKAGVEPVPSKPIDFNDIPLKFVLSRDHHNELVANKEMLTDHARGWNFSRSKYEDKRPWMILAKLQAELTGQSINGSKFSERLYEPKHYREYKNALKRSEEISSSGYPIRFLMDGVRYIQQAAIDLDSVQAWIDGRDTFDYEPVYYTSHGFWPTFVENIRRMDQKGTRRTFADQVTELDDGLYLAEYLPEEVKNSEEYLTFDDAYRIGQPYGVKEHLVRQGFEALVMASIKKEQERQAVRGHCFEVPQYVRSGVLMLHRDRLGAAVDKLHDQRDNKVKTIAVAELILDHYGARAADSYDDLYDELVLGRV